MNGALSHIRVLDLTRILAGPWATQMMADMGAEVIKIERPKTGDDVRAAGPPFLQDRHGNDTMDAAYFLSANRGKKSVALDISKPEAQALVRKLVAQSDVFMENYKTGTLKRYGLDYATLKAINPRLIYCSITGFGQTGPFRSRPGYDFIFQGMSGLMSITGERDDLPGGGPQKVGVAFVDLMTGMNAAVAVLAALAAREREGTGQYIDLALFDVAIAAMANMNSNYLVSGKVPGRMGNAHANLVPYQVFECADGHLILAIGNDEQFANFSRVAGMPEWAQDARFATNPARIRNRETLIPLIQEVIKTRSQDEWVTSLDQVNVCCGPINTIEQALHHPQARAREMVVNVPHPLADTMPIVGSPLKFSDTPVAYGSVPLVGQHTEEVLSSLCDLTQTDIEALRRSGSC